MTPDLTAFDAIQELAAVQAGLVKEAQQNAPAMRQAAEKHRRVADGLKLVRLRDAVLTVANALDAAADALQDLLTAANDENKTVKAALEKVVVKQSDLDEIAKARREAEKAGTAAKDPKWETRAFVEAMWSTTSATA